MADVVGIKMDIGRLVDGEGNYTFYVENLDGTERSKLFTLVGPKNLYPQGLQQDWLDYADAEEVAKSLELLLKNLCRTAERNKDHQIDKHRMDALFEVYRDYMVSSRGKTPQQVLDTLNTFRLM